jgi:ubiquinone/menaquinone biosynthesis C-methylase UbiE
LTESPLLRQAWLAQETAARYRVFTQHSSLHQRLSRVLVEMACIRPGMRVLDLGCGTGVTTSAVVDALDGIGQVYALDLSEAMLVIAREEILVSCVTFVLGDASDIPPAVEGPLDAVVCNAAFWQFPRKANVLARLRKLMPSGGSFVFDIPEPNFSFEPLPMRTQSALLARLAAERHGIGVHDAETLARFLARHGFSVIESRVFDYDRTPEEYHLQLQIPTSTSWMENSIPYPDRLALVDEAYRSATERQSQRVRWMCLHAHACS